MTSILLYVPFVAGLAALAAVDVERRLLPNRIVYPLALWGFAAILLVDRGALVQHLIAAAGAFLFLYSAALARPEGMGMGDVKLAGVMGLYLGAAVIPALLVALVTGTLAGLGTMLREGPGARAKTVPFGVFLALGALVGLLGGAQMIGLYEDVFLSGGSST